MWGRKGLQQDRCFCEKEGETKSPWFEKPNINVPNFFMWAPLWRSCFLRELKIEAQVHHASLVGWFLPVTW